MYGRPNNSHVLARLKIITTIQSKSHISIPIHSYWMLKLTFNMPYYDAFSDN